MRTYYSIKGHGFLKLRDILERSKSIYCLQVDGHHDVFIVSKGCVVKLICRAFFSRQFVDEWSS
jgi:hypothetical protein